eukprot:1159504-Pelagomonas_calceolata.AAC.3
MSAAAWRGYLCRLFRPEAAAAAAAAASTTQLTAAPSVQPATPAAAAAAATAPSAQPTAAPSVQLAAPPPAAPAPPSAHLATAAAAAAAAAPSARPTYWWSARFGGAHSMDGRNLAVPLGRRHPSLVLPAQGDQSQWLPESDAFDMPSNLALSALVSNHVKRLNAHGSPGFDCIAVPFLENAVKVVPRESGTIIPCRTGRLSSSESGP